MKLFITISLTLITLSFMAQNIDSTNLRKERFFIQYTVNDGDIGLKKYYPLTSRNILLFYWEANIGYMTNPKHFIRYEKDSISGNDTIDIGGRINIYDNHINIGGNAGISLSTEHSIWSIGLGVNYTDRTQKIQVSEIKKYNHDFTNQTDMITLKTKELAVYGVLGGEQYLLNNKIFIGGSVYFGAKINISRNRTTSIKEIDYKDKPYISPKLRLGFVF